MEMKSPPPCPATVTVRRNPPRKARATPFSAVPLRQPLSSPSLSRDIFATEIAHNPNNADYSKTESSTKSLPENLKVFLRIRPLTVQKNSRTIAESKNAWPKNPKVKSNSRPKTKKSSEMCVQASEDLRSVTVSTPKPLQEMKRIKSEVYEGFSHVFPAESSQNDVYEEMVKPLVEDFMKGKSGMLAAMGPSGSGKTHSVFGCAREPGMIPLALRRIFSEDESNAAHLSRIVYLSMFEISSERGKGEKMIDLLHDGGDVSLQHSVIKGLREATVCDAQQAESLIARGMLKRSTAMTNSNSQSSRSQCIINIRRGSEQGGEEVDGNASNTILTIVDLAGAEREKKTGNQGARLLESNFINNTSMVFGQCLRSLLEHQRNRNKTLQKHYKNSLLTRYLRDYLEGKKRMMLILTVKPGVEDYLDTSFLLRQASPFAKIKFKTVEEPVNLTNKRPNQALPQAGQLKKMKIGNNEISLIDEGKIDRGFPQNLHKEISGEAIEGCLNQNSQDIYDENINEIHALSNGFVGLGIQEKLPLKENESKLKVKKDREYTIMQGLSKALWNVLKQYKEKLERVEIENCHLRDSLANEKTKSLDLENELTNEKLRILDLEKKVNSDIVSPSLRGLEKTENEKVADPSAIDSVATFASCSDGGDEQHPQQLEDLLESSDDTETTKGFGETSKVDMCFRNNVLSTSINSSREFVCCEDMGTVDIPSTSEATIQSTIRFLCTIHKSEQDAVNVVGDVKNLESESEDIPSTSEATTQSTTRFLYTSHKSEQDAVNVVGEVENSESESECALDGSCLVTSLECESDKNKQDYEDLIYSVNVVGDVKNLDSESECALDGSCLVTSLECENDKNTQYYEDLKDAVNSVGEVMNLESESECALDGSCLVTSLECESIKNTQYYEDLKDDVNAVGDVKNLESESECALDGSCLVTSLECESDKNTQDNEDLKDAVNVVGDVKNLDSESECAVDASCPVTSLECENNKSNQDYEDLKEAKQYLTQSQNDNCVEEQNVPMAAAHLHADLKSSESPRNGDTCNHVKKEGTLEPLGTILPNEGLDAQNMAKILPKVASCTNQLIVKPRRRLQPASSVLLKDLSLLDIKDENEKPKGGKAGKRATADEKSRTQGSLSLLNLLTSKVDR